MVDTTIDITTIPRNPVFIFANPASGSCKAAKYTDIQASFMQLYSPSVVYEVHIYDLQTRHIKETGFTQLATQLAESPEDVRVVVCGGDGTFVWVVEECLRYTLDISRLLLCLMPFGTGNDLACSMGWSRSPPKPIIGQHLKGLKRSLEAWRAATPTHFDLWTVTVTTKPEGSICKIQKQPSGFERVPIRDAEDNPVKFHSRLMSNYFSIGVDARIGLGFDKRRSKSKTINRCIYGWEGIKKMCCLATPHIQEVVTSMTEGDSKVIFTNEDADLENPSVFLAMNCRTYGGGDNYIWDKAKPSQHSRLRGRNSDFTEQSTGDGLLEFLVFPYSVSLALEQVKLTNGQAQRLYQGRGPFKLDLRPPHASDRVYMEIDGEFFYVTQPESVMISLADVSREQQLRVLMNPVTN
jgi:diacylglycerol kinase (ATP)